MTLISIIMYGTVNKSALCVAAQFQTDPLTIIVLLLDDTFERNGLLLQGFV